jgi:D-alanyl-D-alanine carboxypeptidase
MLPFSESVMALVNTPDPTGATPAAAICISDSQQTTTGLLTASSTTPPFTADAPFIMYSITKSLLATTALKLVAKQILDLDLPIVRWLPSLPHARSITLRHLLRHASGLPDYGGLAEYHAAVKRSDQPWSDEEFFKRTQSDQLVYPPGQGWRYSNIGYMVVRQLLEVAQSAPLADILHAEICTPLGLTSTAIITSDTQLAHLTFGPSVELGTPEHPASVAERYHINWVAHRAVASTVREIAQFFEALFDGRLLPVALLREMCTFTPLPTMPDRPVIRPGYGMGLQIDHGWPTGPIYGHSGGGPGAGINVISLRSEPNPITIVVATTREDVAQAEKIAMELLTIYQRE